MANEVTNIERLKNKVSEDLKQFKGQFQIALEYSARAGRSLAELKKELPHGEWLPFLESKGLSVRQSQKLIQLGRDFHLLPKEGRTLSGINQALTAIREAKEGPAKRARPSPRPGRKDIDREHFLIALEKFYKTHGASELLTLVRDFLKNADEHMFVPLANPRQISEMHSQEDMDVEYVSNETDTNTLVFGPLSPEQAKIHVANNGVVKMTRYNGLVEYALLFEDDKMKCFTSQGKYLYWNYLANGLPGQNHVSVNPDELHAPLKKILAEMS